MAQEKTEQLTFQGSLKPQSLQSDWKKLRFSMTAKGQIVTILGKTRDYEHFLCIHSQWEIGSWNFFEVLST